MLASHRGPLRLETSVYIRILVVTSLLQCGWSHPTYQARIPNGGNVPSPCQSGQLWPGVGHFKDLGSGARNPFGVDFEAAGLTWTKELCQKDSDGDGRRNGVELGDPNCEWKQGDPVNITQGLSHPGICEPINSTACEQKTVIWGQYNTQKEWLEQICKTGGLQCPALNEPDVANITVRLPPGTKIPAEETTYECQIFDLTTLGIPDGETFHMVAVTPLIDNGKVLHHMVLSGCQGDVQASDAPFRCGMVASRNCMQFLHVWTLGLDGECYHAQSGVKIGMGGYKFIAIQLHWNNPDRQANLTDSSGMVLHYTPHLREYNAGVLVVGSYNFYLPPKQEAVVIHSTCASGCTQQDMLGPIHVSFAFNHMHYAGRKMSIAISRNGVFLRYLTNEQTYSYDNPQVNLFPDPVVVLPGDELAITCQYDTASRNRTTFFGEATSDEMCFGFLTYYPLENNTEPFCTDYLGISTCNKASLGQCTQPDLFMEQILLSNSTLYKDVAKNCKFFVPCTTECVETLVKYFKTEPCMQGNMWEYVQSILSTNYASSSFFLGATASCKQEVYLALNPASVMDDPGLGIRSATGSLYVLALSVAVVWMAS